MPRLAIYDMDKTITRRATWTPFLTAYAGRNVVPLLATLGPLALFAAKRIDRARLKEMTQALVMGSAAPMDGVQAAADRFAERIVQSEIYDKALAQIVADRTAGYRIVLATASYDFYVRAIAARLGIDDVIATPSTVEGDRLLPRINGENCYGPAKLRMIEAWMAAQGLERAQTHIRFYSDHVSDAPTLDWADAAFAVNPHGALRRLAPSKGWAILDWR
jgi:HAD superfamily hydrolase (TIGR01490 family)